MAAMIWIIASRYTGDQATVAVLSLFQRPAQKAADKYFQQIIKKQQIDSLESLWDHLELMFEQQMLPKGARNELNEHLSKKEACKKDYLSFTSKLRVLATAIEKLISSKTLIDMLFKLQKQDVRIILLSTGRENWPSHWEEFLDLTIKHYKNAFSDRVKGSIYDNDGKTTGKKDSNAIDIDSVKK